MTNLLSKVENSTEHQHLEHSLFHLEVSFRYIGLYNFWPVCSTGMCSSTFLKDAKLGKSNLEQIETMLFVSDLAWVWPHSFDFQDIHIRKGGRKRHWHSTVLEKCIYKLHIILYPYDFLIFLHFSRLFIITRWAGILPLFTQVQWSNKQEKEGGNVGNGFEAYCWWNNDM